MLSIPRRHFLVVAAGSAGAAVSVTSPGLRPALAQEDQSLPEPFGWKDADSMIVHSELTLETEREAIGTSGITSKDVLYVRNNLPRPSEDIVADRDAWEVQIEGVREPRSVTVDELKQMGVETIATVLQCSGNGRGFFEHDTSGSQWLTGAAGNLLWSGVPVRDVVEALGGLEDGRNFMTSTGGEELPEGIDEKDTVVERSVPVDHAMEYAILAWEMNGEPVPLAHGGPLRVVIPGYYGINNVKYVKRVAFTEEESDASIMRTSYRVRPVGVDGAPDQPSMWDMKVKSWITRPLADVESGRVMLYGVAFGGINALDRVEVSTDGGENWQEARLLGPDLGRFSWRPFVLAAELEPGTHTVTSRATDSEGRVQEEATEPNHRGYDYSGWRVLAVDVTVV